MQTSKFATPPARISQGHIFNITKVQFEIDGTKKRFGQLYPEVDLNGVHYGVVLTQACDIEHQKVTHLTIGLLETPPKSATAIVRKDLFGKIFCSIEDRGFWNKEKIVKAVGKELGGLIQNREASLLFLTLESGQSEKHYVVNLSKLFPVRIHHEPSIVPHVTHEMAGDFRALLGWKLANLYGRVGVSEYPDDKVELIAAKMADELLEELKSTFKKESKITAFTEIPDAKNFDSIRKTITDLQQAKTDDNDVQILKLEKSLQTKLQSSIK